MRDHMDLRDSGDHFSLFGPIPITNTWLWYSFHSNIHNLKERVSPYLPKTQFLTCRMVVWLCHVYLNPIICDFIASIK